MIILSNGRTLSYVVASGALGFDGKGWFWEWPLRWLGLINPELFDVTLKTLTLLPRSGNLRWWKPWTWLPFSPWSCVRFLPGGAVNKVGLTNKGFDHWCEKIAPKIDFKEHSIIVSIWGTTEECVKMAKRLNDFADLTAIEVNNSCPNTGHASQTTEASIMHFKAIKAVSIHPIIAKIAVEQEYLVLAQALEGIVAAFALNSVKWETVYTPEEKSPLRKLEKKVGGGGGGVSGRPAQRFNWTAVSMLAKQGKIPVIAPSIMSLEDLWHVESLGAKAFSFGAIHLKTPWKATSIVFDHIVSVGE